MSRLALNVGDGLAIDGHEHVVVRRLPGNRLQLEHRDTSEPLVTSDAELLSKWTDNKVVLRIRRSHDRFGSKVATCAEQMRRDFEALDENSKAEARRKLVYVQGVLAAEPRSLTQVNVKPLIPAIAASLGERIGNAPETPTTDPYVIPVKQRRAPSASSICRWIGFWQRSGEDICSATIRMSYERRSGW